jgi:hypothetical protein
MVNTIKEKNMDTQKAVEAIVALASSVGIDPSVLHTGLGKIIAKGSKKPVTPLKTSAGCRATLLKPRAERINRPISEVEAIVLSMGYKLVDYPSSIEALHYGFANCSLQAIRPRPHIGQPYHVVEMVVAERRDDTHGDRYFAKWVVCKDETEMLKTFDSIYAAVK